MFDEYLLDYYDEIEGGHYVCTDSDLLTLLAFTTPLEGNWQIIKGERVEGLFYPLRVVARSADV